MIGNHVNLAEGVRPANGWPLVEAKTPDLIATWQSAREAFDLHEAPYQAGAADWQRRAGAIRRRPESQYAKALQEAEAAVLARLEALIAEGAVIYAGFPQGQLDGEPRVIPLEALGHRRPRSARVTVHGLEFFRVRLFPAEALAAAEPEVEPVPPATLGALVEALVELFAEDSAWAIAGDARLAEMVAARDARFRPHHGPAKHGRWAASTLRQRIKECRAEAKAQADPKITV